MVDTTTEKINNRTYISRGIDYLGALGAKLRDLKGFKTLAHELIQNADDVDDANYMSFDVCEHALIVENDGTFSDCGAIEQDECPWKEEPEKGHRCDFHRFRSVAAGDKRAQEGTTGAFGIGFIAVYQITDNPELISGHHWILHEDQPEDKRIEICHGCDKCKSDQLPGTRFIFPWAQDSQSKLRQELRAEAVSETDIESLFKEFQQSLSTSMLFLKRLRKIVLKRNGKIERTFERIDENNSLILTDGNSSENEIWHIFKGDFKEKAKDLLDKQPGRIEKKRSSVVTIAIPEQVNCEGLLCAFLPTEQKTDFPFHINADFFTSNDRKRVLWADDYQSEWNRAALEAAASTLANSLDSLPNLLGHKSFWGLLDNIKKVYDEVKKTDNERVFAFFWEEVSSRLKDKKIIFTTSSEWTTARDSFLLLQSEEKDAIPLLEKLGMKIVSEDLRPFQSLLRSDIIGVSLMDIPAICEALSAIGLNAPVQKNDWPSELADIHAFQILWKEINLLRNRNQRNLNVQSHDSERLRGIAIAPVVGEALFPCGEAYFAEDYETIKLFTSICPTIPFLSNELDLKDFKDLRELCSRFDAAAAIKELVSFGPDLIKNAWEKKIFNLNDFFVWFEKRRDEILNDEQLKRKFCQLSIFPSLSNLTILSKLVLPGNFDDKLGLAEIIDLKAFNGRREFLRDLGMQSLDFKTYVLGLPSVLNGQEILVIKRDSVVELLAKHKGEIEGDQQVHAGLASTDLIKCIGGKFHKANDCYFQTDAITACLDEHVFIVDLSKTQTESIKNLYVWLGVATEPRIPDIIKRVKSLANCPYSLENVSIIANIVEHLGHRFRAEDPPPELETLRNIKWLPARGDADYWHTPNELFAVFQDYLFETQGPFLDITRNIQNKSSFILEFLGVKKTPDPGIVVKHLQKCMNDNIRVHQEVYRFLNDNSDNSVIERLKNKKCLFLNEQYYSPNQVFWEEHPFGTYRQRLGEELLHYRNLFNRLGVHTKPGYKDAFAVLKEIADSFEKTKRPLEDETQAILMACWRLIEKELETEHFNDVVSKELKAVKCVLNRDKMLSPPEWIFFENRAGLTEKFDGFLFNNVIPKPIGAAKAMAAAGVRPLSTAIQIKLLNCENPKTDTEVSELIRRRRNELGRILDSQVLAEDLIDVLSRLEKISFETASLLTIRYELRAFDSVLESKPEDTPALYLPDGNRLIFTRRNENIMWPPLSRELAIALLPEEDPGKIAAGIKEVLSAENAAQVAQTLDELGYPKLDTSVSANSNDSGLKTTLGAGIPISEELPTAPIFDKESQEPEQPSNKIRTKQPPFDAQKKMVNINNSLKQNQTTNRTKTNPNVPAEQMDSNFNYPNELIAVFNRPEKKSNEEIEDLDEGKVSDPEGRREKEAAGHIDRITNEPAPADRRRITERALLEGPDEAVRSVLEEWYGGKCQICDNTFRQRNGRPFFIASYLVQRKLARQVDNYANAICLCAEHFARWQHGAVQAQNILNQILSLKCQKEGGDSPPIVQIKLCGEDRNITFNEKHLVALQELLNVSQSIGEFDQQAGNAV